MTPKHECHGQLRWRASILVALPEMPKLAGVIAENPIARTRPIYFIHSRQDEVVSYRQTQELANLYAGPKTVWLADKGSHAAIWDADHAGYENRLTEFLRSVR